MLKLSTIFISIISLLSFVSYSHAEEVQKWECAVNLHQGDSGILSLENSAGKVTGMMSIKRNESEFKSEVSGNWVAEQINLKRLLDSGSNDLMTGAVIALGTKKVKIGGRFSVGYQGVWSADCDLVSSLDISSKSSSTEKEPSTTSRITPSNPTNKDSIVFFARATHPDGIESLSFFINDKKVHTCESNSCEFSKKPLASGSHTWFAQAESKTGIKNKVRQNKLIVQANSSKESCSISGQAKGPSAALSSIYRVHLYGPNRTDSLYASTGFKDNSYEFKGLPEGKYTVQIDTQADKAIIASPLSKTIECSARKIINFDLR